MNDGKNIITAALVLLTLTLTSYQVMRRVNWDRTSRNYTIATRYGDLSRAGNLYGETELDLAGKLRKEGLKLVLFTRDLVTNEELSAPESANELGATGLEVGLEVQNLQLADQSQYRQLLEVIKELDPAYLVLRGIDRVDIPPKLTDWIRENEIILGTVEFRNQGTTREVVENHELDHVRLHRVFDKETGTLTEAERIARYVRAVEERNIGVIEYRLPLNVDLDVQLRDLASIRENLDDVGYESVPLGQAKGTGEAPEFSLWISLLLIAGSIGSGIFILLINKQLTSTVLLGGLLLLFAVTGLALAIIPILTRQISSLAIALGAPALAFLFLKRYGLTSYANPVPGATYLDFLAVSAFSTFAGLVVSSILLDESFLLKLYQFRGVKVSLFLPLVVLLVLAIYTGEFRISEIRLSFGKVLAGAALIGLLLFLLVRSGNFNFLRSTDLEEAIRRWLDATLMVRPRFKEFVIGHPALIAWLYLAGRHPDKFQFCKLGLFLLGFIGQVSIINTFVHVHTPITVSLIRTVNGLAGGLILGTGLLVLIMGGVYLWNNQLE